MFRWWSDWSWGLPLLLATVVFHVSMFVLIERALVLRAGWGVHAHPRHYFIVAIALRYAPGAFPHGHCPFCYDNRSYGGRSGAGAARGSARYTAGPVCWLKLSAQLIKPT